MSIARPQLRRMVLGHGHFAGQVPVSAYFCSLKNLKDLTGCTCLDCLARSLSFASSAINLSCRSRTHVLGHLGMRVEGFQGLGFGVWGSGFRVQGSRFRVQGPGTFAQPRVVTWHTGGSRTTQLLKCHFLMVCPISKTIIHAKQLLQNSGFRV